MKGTDVTAEELSHAECFLSRIVRGFERDGPDDDVPISKANLIRLVAWYGAIRADGRKPGTLTLRDQEPNP